MQPTVSEHRAAFELDRLITRVNGSGLNTVRDSLIRVMQLISDPTSDAKDLTDYILRDPALAANVLRRVNSAFYAIPRQITDIKQAVVALGFDEVRNLVLQQKSRDLFTGGATTGRAARLDLWKHSVAVALYCRKVYRKEWGEPGGDAYTAGILHDIGLIVEDQFLTAQYQEVLRQRSQMRNNIVYAEEQVMGFNHAQVGERLTKSWQVPESLTIPIGLHHKPVPCDPKHERMTSVLYLADHLCQTARLGFQDTPMLSQQHLQRILAKLSMENVGAEMILDEVKTEIAVMEKEGWFAHGA